MERDESSVIPNLGDWHGAAGRHHYYVCDVFTSEPLTGNQLAVYVDGRPFDTDGMQRVAREMNIAETVFLLPPQQGGDVAVRIFTPDAELPFAGHPVLGTAFVVGTALGSDAVILETGGGLVPVALEWQHSRVMFGRMQQPLPIWEPYAQAAELLRAVGVSSSELPIDVYRNGPVHTYIKLARPEDVAGLRPDMGLLKDLGVAANCFARRGQEWKTRMFYPGIGVSEDPATGSAAGPLAIHLARHGEIAYGEEITIRQGEEMERPSLLRATAFGSGDVIERVEVGGSAVIVAEGFYRMTA